MKVDSGIAVTAQTVHDADLEEFGRTVAERIGLNGVANVQAKGAASGEPALLEVNARFPGTMPLTVASGVDMPALCVKEALGEPKPEGTLDFEPTAMVRLMREHYMDISEIEDMRVAQAATAEKAKEIRDGVQS
jgi:carbamoyl-phosphate synthase large subunit